MARKSRKRAAKYSELSKAKKKRQLDRSSLEPKVTSIPKYQEVAEPTPRKSPIAKTVPKPQAGARQPVPSYQYVRDDLKRIGILTGGVVVILIVLAFILR